MVRRRLASLAAAAILLTVLGCRDSPTGNAPPAAESASTAAGPAAPLVAPDATYVLRGKVTALPRPGAAPPELVVHHEAIPSFADARNRVVGMDSMEMPFAVGRGVSLDGIAPGDAVEMRLELRWAATPPATLGMVRELPPDTPLQLAR